MKYKCLVSSRMCLAQAEELFPGQKPHQEFAELILTMSQGMAVLLTLTRVSRLKDLGKLAYQVCVCLLRLLLTFDRFSS